MQGGSISVNAVAIAIVDALATCHHTILATVYEPAMCHRPTATAQTLAICYCQKLSRAGVHTCRVLLASLLLSASALPL